MRPGRLVKFGAHGATFIVAYVCLDWLTFIYALEPIGVTPWGLSTGLAVAQLLRHKLSFLPFFFVASVASDFLVGNQRIPLLWSMVLAAIKCVGYAGAIWVLTSKSGSTLQLRSLRHVTWFAIAGVVSAMVVAASCAGVFRLSGLIGAQSILDALIRYWIGDVLGILVFTPLMFDPRPHLARLLAEPSWPKAAEMLAQLAAILIALWIVFGLDLSLDLNDFSPLYPLFLPIIWITVRHGIEGAAVALAIVQVAMMLALESHGYDIDRVISFQFFVLSIAITGLFLGAVVSERQDAMAATADRELRLDTIFRAAADGIIVIDAKGAITSANPAAFHLFGLARTELIGRAIADVLDGGIPDNRQAPWEASIRRADRGVVPVEASISTAFESTAGALTIVLRDATLRKESEARQRRYQAELARVSRAAIAGETAAAIIHEVGQPTSAVATYVTTARILLAQPEIDRARILESLNKASSEALRSVGIFNRLRELLHGSAMKPEPTDVTRTIGAVIGMLQPELAANGVRVELGLPAHLPEIPLERMHIEQVLLNLIRNAIEAMLDDPPDARRLRIDVLRSPGALEISVSDSGPGIDSSIVDRLFHPFVGTKEKGMGLGLSVSRSMIQAHGGTLAYEPVSPRGARFVIRLPTKEGASA